MNNKHIKIGERILNSDQAKVLLPTYDNIFNLVNNFRNEARNANNTSKVITHNFISILGGRGSGKSSVMRTIQNKLIDNENDIVLPLISPDVISNANDVMGWLLNSMYTEIKSIQDDYVTKCKKERAFEDEIYKQCIKQERTSLEESYYNLQKSYLFRKQEYFNKIQSKNEGVAEYITDNKAFVTSDKNIQDKFITFINELINTKQKISNKSESLVFIFFDDVDISAERCPEVLDLMLTFLSNTNIVVFITGEYKIFAEMLTIHFLQKEEISSQQYDTSFISSKILENRSYSINDTAIQLRRVRSLEYLKKALPPSFRFEMKKVMDKGAFSYPVQINDSNTEINLTLNELLSNIKIKNNKQPDKKVELTFIDAYFSIFDDTPRGLINIYYFLYQRKDIEWTVEDVFQFANVIIHSSWTLIEFKEELDSLISYKDKTIEIDYDNLFLLTDSNKITLTKNKITVYLLFDFLGKLLHSNNQPSIFNDRIFSALNELNSNKKLFPESIFEETMSIYSQINKVFNDSNLNSLFRNELTTSSERVFYETITRNKHVDTINYDNNLLYDDLVDTFEYYFPVDPIWVKEHINFITKSNINFQVIFSKNKQIFKKDFFNIDVINENFNIEQLIKTLIDKHLLENPKNKDEIDKEIKLYEMGLEIFEEKKKQKKLNDEIKLLNQRLLSLKSELSDLSEKDIENYILQREAFINKIKEFEVEFERNKDAWDLVKSNMKETKSSNNIDGSFMYLIEFNPEKIINDLEIIQLNQTHNQESIVPIEKSFLFSSIILDKNLKTMIENYFIADKSIKFLKKYTPIDYKKRLDEQTDLETKIFEKNLEKDTSNYIKEQYLELLKKINKSVEINEDFLKEYKKEIVKVINKNLENQLYFEIKSIANINNFNESPEMIFHFTTEIFQIINNLFGQGLEYFTQNIELSNEAKSALKSILEMDPQNSNEPTIKELIINTTPITLEKYETFIKDLESNIQLDYLNIGSVGRRRRLEEITKQITFLKSFMKSSTIYTVQDFSQKLYAEGYVNCINKLAYKYLYLKSYIEFIESKNKNDEFWEKAMQAIERKANLSRNLLIKPEFLRYLDKVILTIRGIS